jgi:hypothetical protein
LGLLSRNGEEGVEMDVLIAIFLSSAVRRSPVEPLPRRNKKIDSSHQFPLKLYQGKANRIRYEIDPRNVPRIPLMEQKVQQKETA